MRPKKRPQRSAARKQVDGAGSENWRPERISFNPETYTALDRLARDRMSTLQDLADEAFRDLLKKHKRPVTLKEILRESARSHPANDRHPLRKSSL